MTECGHRIDPGKYAVCGVCDGLRLCLDRARTHLCTRECASRGCEAGLCVEEVRDGAVALDFGIR